MGSKEEPEKKRRHVNNTLSSSPQKKALPPSEEKKQLDAAELQYENHKLAQQLDVQRNEIHALELKYQDLKHKQTCYDESLASIQEAWEELVDDVELLSVRANAPNHGLQLLEPSHCSEDSVDGSVPPEEIFLHRLLHNGAIENSGTSNGTISAEGALEQRQASTLRLVENAVQAIEMQHRQNEALSMSLMAATSAEDCRQQVDSILKDLRTEIGLLKSVMNSLDSRHNSLATEITLCQNNHARDQAELKRLKGDIEETLADLETSRRKLAALRNQKDCQLSTAGSISSTRETSSKESKELETALAEAKNLALQRLDEIKVVQQEKLSISEEILKLQESLSNETYITASAPYASLLEEAQHLKEELEQAQTNFYKKEAERDHCLQLEKETVFKAEAGEAAQKIESVLKARISELESNLEKCLSDTSTLEEKLERESLSSEAKDEVAEYKVMVSTLHKEMRMMQQQLNQHKEAALGSYSLRAEVQSLHTVLDRKTRECKNLADKVASQSMEVNTLKDEVRLLRESEQELKLILEMFGRESIDSRAVETLHRQVVEFGDLEVADLLDRLWGLAHFSITGSVDASGKSQERQKKAADRHRRDLKLKENDWVLLRFEKARLRKIKGKERLFPKLSVQYYSPFQIIKQINDVSFRLKLPDTWKIHNAFHVSLLKPFKGDVPDDGEPDEQPEVEENEEILVPEQILAHKDTKNKGKVRSILAADLSALEELISNATLLCFCREARELKQAECRAWAQVERLKTVFDEHTLELKVKEAIEAEAASQQKLATAEAEIAELRQRIDASDRDAHDASEVLRMKSEEGDVYLTEIETIGQAYEDMQTQNQRLLQQITERDDYNLKLIFEGFKTKQVHASLVEEKQSLTTQLRHINSLGECYKMRAARLEEQARAYSEQVGKAVEDARQQSIALEQAKQKFADTEKELSTSKATLQEATSALEKQRSTMMEAETQLEKERFERRRLQEELAMLNMKAGRLNVHHDSGALVEKLQEEIKEYKAILKCGICNDRSKEVVITKCFHLFCNPCVQKSLDSRHRKCPACGAVFGPNDVRTVYI
ncbi:hypothetical protein L7F22_014203 [Adiantum nelumboides]|nr:hypothetical protein [Adiantum nelumboides]